MKKSALFSIFTLATSVLFAQNTLKSNKDSVAYALGVNTASNIVKEIETVGLSTEMFLKGFQEVNNSIIPAESIEPLLRDYFTKLQQEQESKMQAQAQEMCLANSEFLLKNKENKDVVTLENGLQYKVVVKGKDKKTPNDNDRVKVHYKGSLIDGTVFDSSIDRGEPATFPVNALIPGFTQILKLMTVGSTYIAYIPSELGYGMKDMGTIKPCSTLIFEIQLLEIISDETNEAIENDSSKKSKKK
ncbi:MAG: FKBP-type peptidyl-prolyl cis-trans isomerase [Bacteroidales bacterium]|nr:FKBP-type peptidyl-prolyl cis-trans isomerase [Bacteroidales bacterium]